MERNPFRGDRLAETYTALQGLFIYPGKIVRMRYPDNLGGYPERCIHARPLIDDCESCRMM
jgi:hypothetical protein